MNDKAPDQTSPETALDSPPLAMLKELAHREGVEPGEDGVTRFKVHDQRVDITIYPVEQGAPHPGAENWRANVVGSLEEDATDHSVQVMKDGTVEGRDLGHLNDGDVPPEVMSSEACLDWLGKVCGKKVDSGVAA